MTRREVITKAITRQLSWVQASEILGISAGIGDDFALFGCVRGFDSCMRMRLIFRSPDNPAAQPTETERQKANVNLFACKSAKVGARRKAASKNGIQD
jgi:hypothetical protein